MNLSKDEKSLLLYFETCAVDNTGRVDQLKMNDIDREIAERWNSEGYIKYGRICYKDCIGNQIKQLTHFIFLSEEAWDKVHKLRRERANRMWKNKSYMTAEEKQKEIYKE